MFRNCTGGVRCKECICTTLGPGALSSPSSQETVLAEGPHEAKSAKESSGEPAMPLCPHIHMHTHAPFQIISFCQSLYSIFFFGFSTLLPQIFTLLRLHMEQWQVHMDIKHGITLLDAATGRIRKSWPQALCLYLVFMTFPHPKTTTHSHRLIHGVPCYSNALFKDTRTVWPSWLLRNKSWVRAVAEKTPHVAQWLSSSPGGTPRSGSTGLRIEILGETFQMNSDVIQKLTTWCNLAFHVMKRRLIHPKMQTWDKKIKPSPKPAIYVR